MVEAEGDSGDLVDAGELVRGLRVEALDPGDEYEAAFLMVKVRYPNGSRGWVLRKPQDANVEEVLGALVAQSDVLRKELLDEWE